MAIDLLLILLLHTENNLRRDDSFVGVLEMQIWVEAKGCCVFIEMGGDHIDIEALSQACDVLWNLLVNA